MTVRIASLFLLAALSALSFGLPEAAAQEYVECRSQNYQYRECPVPWYRVEMVRQFSDSRCVEDRTWGQGRGFVWVHQGCAANFGPARGGPGGGWQPGRDEIACRSERNRYNECRVDWRSAQLAQQTSQSRCVENETWGFRRGAVWVDKGCSGIFAETRGRPPGGGGHGDQMQCSSDRNRYKECPVGNWGGAHLVRQSSRAPCVEGRTWGYGRGVLWVDQGCAGTFAPSQGHWNPGGARRMSCNSEGNRYRNCPTGGWRGAQLVRQTSRASCVENRTWGFRQGAIWVDKGCSADFVEERRW